MFKDRRKMWLSPYFLLTDKMRHNKFSNVLCLSTKKWEKDFKACILWGNMKWNKKWSLNKSISCYHCIITVGSGTMTFNVIHRWWPSADTVRQVTAWGSNVTIGGLEDRETGHWSSHLAMKAHSGRFKPNFGHDLEGRHFEVEISGESLECT